MICVVNYLYPKFYCNQIKRKKKNGRGRGFPIGPFIRKIFQTHIDHNNLLCAYNLYVEFHSNRFTIIECCFRGSVNMEPVDQWWPDFWIPRSTLKTETLLRSTILHNHILIM